MRKVFLFICFCFGLGQLVAQDIILASGSTTTCSATLLDPGGPRNYGNNLDIVGTFCPSTPSTQLSLTFAWSDIAQGDLLCIYDGESISDPELSCSSRWTGARIIVQATAANTSGCLTLSFRSNSSITGKGFTASLACVPICQPVVPVLAQAQPATIPTDSSSINLCPGQIIELRAGVEFPQNDIAYHQSAATTTYRWTLPDGREVRNEEIQYAFAAPGGYILELNAVDAQGCRSLQPLQVHARVADRPTIAIGSELLDTLCAPQTLQLSLNGTGENSITGTTPVQYFQPVTSKTDSLPLPDGTGASHESTIVITQFQDGATLTSPDQLRAICASMEHSWLRDLSIELISPDGRTVTLHNHPGRFGGEAFLGEPIEQDAGSNQPIPGVGYTYCWNNDDPKGDWLTFLNANPTIVTIPAGTYRSYEFFNSLIGSPLNGAWTLRITDHWEADNGWIFDWSIEFSDDIPLAVDSFKTTIVDQYFWRDDIQSAYSPKEISYSPTVPGSITVGVTLVNDFGCSYDTSLTVVVLPQNNPACGPCTATIDTLPEQIIQAGDTLRFNLENAGAGSSRFAANGKRVFTHSSNPPQRPLTSTLSISDPPVAQLGTDGDELVTICLGLEARDFSEIAARIITPSGESLRLMLNDLSGVGGQQTVCFSSDAAQRINSATSAADTLRPRTDWTAIGGATTRGDWRLELSDAAGFLDTSFLHRWWLDFEGTTITEVNAPAEVTQVSTNEYFDIPAQHTSYTFSYEDEGGCLRTLIYPVIVQIPCVLSLKRLGYRDPSCLQEPDGELLVTAEGNQGEVTYSLQGQTNTTGKFTGLIAGNYLVSAVDSALCPTSLPLELSAPAGITSTIQSSITSCDPLLYEVDVTLLEAVRLREAVWIDDASVTDGFRQNLPPGEYRYKTIDERGCIVYHQVSLPNRNPLQVSAQAIAPACSVNGDGRIEISISGGIPPYDVGWSDGAFGQVRENIYSGDYEGIVEDAGGCQARFAVRLEDPSTLTAIAEIEPNWCANETSGAVILRVTEGDGPFECRADGGPWQAGTLLYGLSEGEHTIELRNARACLWSSEVYIPTLSSLGDSLDLVLGNLAYGEPMPIDAASGKHGAVQRVFWRYSASANIECDTCITTFITPYESGLLYAIVEDTLGCRVEGSAQLLLEKEVEIYVPSGFWPDGPNPDNQILRVHGRSGTLIERFVLFDRWGTLIYESGPLRANSPNGWDGTYRGQPAAAGIYLYEVSVRNKSGAISRVSGNTSLLR